MTPGDIGGGASHSGGVSSDSLQTPSAGGEFHTEWRARVEREQVRQWESEAIGQDEVPHYLVEVLIGVEIDSRGERPMGYAMWVDADVNGGVERRVRIRPDPSKSTGYRLEEGAELPPVIGVEPGQPNPLTYDLSERYEEILADAHGIGGDER